MADTNRWPIDYENVKRGNFITPKEISRITGKVYPDPLSGKSYSPIVFNDWLLAKLALQQRIERDLREIKGRIWVVRHQKDGLQILTDEAQLEHAGKKFNTGMRVMQKQFAASMAVEPAFLPDEKKASHDRQIVFQGKILQAVTQVKRSIKAVAHRRSTPGLPE